MNAQQDNIDWHTVSLPGIGLAADGSNSAGAIPLGSRGRLDLKVVMTSTP